MAHGRERATIGLWVPIEETKYLIFAFLPSGNEAKRGLNGELKCVKGT